MDVDWIPESWPFKTPTSKSSKCREGSVTERRQEAIQQEISSKLQKINEPGETVQGIFVDTKSDDNFSHRDDVSQDGSLQH